MRWLKRWFGADRGRDSQELPVLRPEAYDPPADAAYRFSDPNVRIAVTADIHGRSDLLRRHFARLDQLARDTTKTFIEVYLGDYVDRSGDPREVLELLIERKAHARGPMVLLLGNHEEMLLAALEDDKAFVSWIEAGGHSTLASYGISPAGVLADPAGKRNQFRQALGETHRAFLRDLPLVYRHGGFFFVHAGVRPGVPLDRQSRDDLLWIRGEFLKCAEDFGEIVVHGHTPARLPQFERNRIGLDVGACYFGTMMSLVLDSQSLTSIVTSAESEEG